MNHFPRLSTLQTLATSVVVLALLVLPVQATNLVANGSFENIGTNTASFSISKDGVLPNWAATPSGNKILDCLIVAGATMNLCGTTAFGGGFTFWENPGPSPDGGNFVGMDGYNAYSTPLTQTITGLLPGASYAISFYQAAGQQRGFDGATTERWQVQFGSASQLSVLMSNANHGHVNWMSQTLTFTASAASQVLSFIAIGTPNGLPPFVLLDGVSINQVPEPATSGLIVLGMLAIPVAARFRRKS